MKKEVRNIKIKCTFVYRAKTKNDGAKKVVRRCLSQLFLHAIIYIKFYYNAIQEQKNENKKKSIL